MFGDMIPWFHEVLKRRFLLYSYGTFLDGSFCYLTFSTNRVITLWLLSNFDTDGEVIFAGANQSANQRVERPLSVVMG
jgi:hypothetical protein